MPSHRVHRVADRLVFGRTFEEIHAWKDAPAQQIPGPRHRQYRHDHLSNAIIAAELGDPQAFLAGELHDYLDKTVSALPKRARTILELLVK